MPLTFNLKSARDLFGKLNRDADALREEVSSDQLFNFVVTGYSIIDWVKKDPSVTPLAQKATAINGLYQNYWLRICGDLATACKHFQLTERRPVIASTLSTTGYGAGRYGHGLYGVGEESIMIELNDGTTIACLDLVQGVLAAWETFFCDYEI